MENGVEVAVEQDLVEKGGELGKGGEKVAVGGGLDEGRVLDGDDEVFVEAREQLPQVKAVAGDVNEEEVYVTPVVSGAINEMEGAAAFEEAIEVHGAGDDGGGEQVEKEEDVEAVANVKSGFLSSGRTYADVLVQTLDVAGHAEDNVKETADMDTGGNIENSQVADAVVDKSEIQEVDDKKVNEIGKFGLQTSEGTKSVEVESNSEASHVDGQANGVFSQEYGNSENLEVGPTETDSSEVKFNHVDDIDKESSASAIPWVGQEDVENDNLRRGSAATEPEEVLKVNMSEPDTIHDAKSVSIGTGDNHYTSDHELQGDNNDVTNSLIDSSCTEEFFQYTDIVVPDHQISDVFEDTGELEHTKEVDVCSLPPVEDGRTAASEVTLGERSVIGANQSVETGQVAGSNEGNGLIKEQRYASVEEPEQSNVREDSKAGVPALVTDSVSDHSSTKEIRGETHAVAGSEVTHGVRAGSEVTESVNVSVSEKKSKQQNKEQERTASVPASSSNRSTSVPSLPARPAGLGRAAPLLDPAPRSVQQPRVNGSITQAQVQLVEEASNGENEENDETREKLQMIRVKFLRLAHRLGQTPHNVVVAQVLYRLGLAEQLRGRNGGRVGAFSFDRASAMAEQLEAVGQEPLDFSCTIMVLGKTGVGKSATINSIFDEVKFGTDAFQSGTKKVQDVVGTVQGIKVRVIDTPGLLSSWSDQSQNEKILQSVKRFIKKTPPDIVLYLDRLDMQSRDFGDMPLLRTITKVFGPSIWFNAIVVLTHAASAPPDGPNGIASNYDTFVTQRSHVVQNAVRQAAGDMRLMNPVSLVENHSACRTNRAGQRVLPNGQVWKPHLLLLSFASKILAEANTLLKLQDGPPGKTFATRSRAPPLPYLLSSMLQSRPHLKLPEEQMGGDDTLDDELDVSSDSDDDSEYDELPPFKPLTKAQLSKLSKAQRKDYFDELEYREKLLMKKQLKEEKLRRKMMKKMAAAAKDMPKDHSENVEEDNGAAASVPVPMPDLALPASFDSDNPTHRYRYLDSSNPWLVRPVLETQGWDHDVGYEGLNVERSFVVKEKVPLSFSGQITKDKKDATVQMEVAGTLKHGEGKATSVGFDLQTVGKDIAYTLRSESTFCNFIRNKATAGVSFTLLGDALSAGMKLEDKIIASKRFRMVVAGGAMTNRGDVAYGGTLEATLRDKDHPLGRSLSTLGLSIMDWHGDLAIGCNVQSQIPIGRYSNIIARANLSNKGSGQVSLRLNSSEQLQIALIALLPLLRRAFSLSQESLQY
uniref:AIG1-type G domain-containing protein n=1 Tax=Kalanchoe fedtschenkoi TaxID=63787 RepID=A0A7N0UZW3_KALFE